MRVLNLFSGIGGNRYLWSRNLDVTAVDNNWKVLTAYKKMFPMDEVRFDDAYQFLENNYKNYDVVWASPPCVTHSSLGRAVKKRLPDLRLYSLVIFLMKEFKGNWVVENVRPYYRPLIGGRVIGRHIFWSNIELDNDIILPKFNGNFVKAKSTVKEYLKNLEDYLGFKIKKRIYMNGNHDPGQVYRNCVHPILGRYVMDQCLKSEI